MRHLRSILYVLVLAPVLWVLTGVGFNQDLTTRGRDTFAVESFTGLLLLLLAGAAYGILVFAPISPAGPTLAGLAYLGIALWALSAPDSYAGAFPASVTKDGFDLSRPGYGLAAMLAVPLICTALSARRWAKYEPPVLPIIGVIGRARGAAAVAGTPVAVLETQVIGTPAGSARAGSSPGSSPGSSAGSSPGSEPTAVLRMPAERPRPSVAAPAPAPADGDPTIAVVTPEDAPSTAIVISADETVDVAATPAGADDVTEPVVAGSAEAEETTVATPVVNSGDGGDAGDDRTQAIRLPDGVDGDRTQAISLPATDDQDRTQAISLPAVDDQDRTQALPLPASPREPAGDETQVIRPPAQSADQDRTQVLRTGLVKPPGDSPEVLKLPVTGPAPSIAALEQPNLADDPTSRLAAPREQTNSDQRSAVLNMERPPDEVADDTTRLDVPVQRRPTADES